MFKKSCAVTKSTDSSGRGIEPEKVVSNDIRCINNINSHNPVGIERVSDVKTRAKVNRYSHAYTCKL